MLEQILLFVVAAPGVAFLLLSLAWLLGIEIRERTVARLTNVVFVLVTAGSAWLGLSMYADSLLEIHWDGGIWFRAAEYAFQLDLIADRLAMPLIMLTAVLVGLVGLFSVRYMHRESGFLRFFILLHLFAFGSMLVFAAGSFDLFIGGWELVGISSALLVAFFQQRREPVRSSVHVFSIYRVGDLGLLLGVFVLHYMSGTAEIGRVFTGAWPTQSSALSPTAATLTGLLFLFAAAAKSAQVPFFGWLPRAMEGPTPSSAIFYGAISVHAGAYLLLRIYPALAASPVAAAAVVAVGFVSAIVGTALHRVVADAKSGIAYAAMTQLGIIFMEIGLGFPKLALAHILGHAVVRTLQFLRAPSMLHDYHRVHAAAGGHLGKTGGHFEHVLPESVRMWAYRVAIDRGFYDAFVIRAVVNPAMALSRWLGSFEPGTAGLEAGARRFAEEKPAVRSMQGTKA
jgi:NAD(P)H-quinone oxidoreductase subunit 5